MNEPRAQERIPKVAIIVLNWNGLEDTAACLNSLQALDYPELRIVVVDNASNGPDVAELMLRFAGHIDLVANERNLGYSEGNNVGIRHALQGFDPAYLLILNNDTVVEPSTLATMVGLAEMDPCIGIVGAKTLHFDRPGFIQLTTTRIERSRGRVLFVGEGEEDLGQHDQVSETDFVQGSCMLIKRSVVQTIGLFNGDYFCYWEDAEYCLRARSAGFKCLFCPTARVWHKGSWSGEKSASIGAYYGTRNRFWLLKEFSTRKEYIRFAAYYLGARFWLSAFRHLIIERDLESFRSLCRGVWDGLMKPPVRSDPANQAISG
jgi:GT2 family glycosyltransferase